MLEGFAKKAQNTVNSNNKHMQEGTTELLCSRAKQMGYTVMNPVEILKDLQELKQEDRIKVCYRLVDIADIIFMVSGWQKSKGANAELSYAKSLGKEVKYQDYYAPFRKVTDDENS